MPSTLSMTDLPGLIQGYRLCAKTEGKSDKTIAIVANSVRYLEEFLRSEGLPTNVTQIGPREIRTFILYLQQKRRFSGHPFNKTQDRGLSGHTIDCYLRSIRAFWSWLVSEEVMETNPLARLKIPKAPKKVVTTIFLSPEIPEQIFPRSGRRYFLRHWERGKQVAHPFSSDTGGIHSRCPSCYTAHRYNCTSLHSDQCYIPAFSYLFRFLLPDTLYLHLRQSWQFNPRCLTRHSEPLCLSFAITYYTTLCLYRTPPAVPFSFNTLIRLCQRVGP